MGSGDPARSSATPRQWSRPRRRGRGSALLRPFRYVQPTTVVEASTELAHLGDGAKVYAGGAELLLLMREGIVRPSYLVDVKAIPDLQGISWDGEVVRIGATETHQRIETHPLVRRHLPLLSEATRHIGNVRVRSQGTLGGNLCFADPYGDPATALLVHDTAVRVSGVRGQRLVDLAPFVRSMYEVDLAPDEILVEIQVRPLPAPWRHAYLRFEQLYRPTLNVAAAAEVAGDRLERVRLAVGCVGPKARRLGALEEEIRGYTLAEAARIVAASSTYLTEQLEPASDLLGSAELKVHLAAVLLSRALRHIATGSEAG